MTIYNVYVELEDAYGRMGRKSYTTANSVVDFAAAQAAASALCDDLASLTEMDILAYTVSLRSSYSDTVTPGANKDEGLTMVLRKSDNTKDVIKVPAPVSSLFDGYGNVDIADVDIASYLVHFMTGGNFTFSDNEQAIQLLSGHLDK